MSGYTNSITDINDNVGIGATSSGYKLDVNGGIGVLRTDGITFTGAVSSGNSIKSDSSNNFILNTTLTSAPYTESERVRISNNGNVGIGTTSPTQKLTVEGNIELGTGGYIYGDTTTPRLRLSNAAGAVLSYGTSHLQNGGSLQFVTTAGTKFRINANGGGYVIGNFGIDTTSPQSLLHLGGTPGTLSSGLTFGDGDTGFYEYTDDKLYMQVGATTYRIHTYQIDSNASNGFALRTGNASSTNPVYSFNNDADTGIGWGGSDTICLITGGTERMRITSTGNVGIGTTFGTEALNVVGKITLNDGGNSVYIGDLCGSVDDGTDNKNVGVGNFALFFNTSGYSNTANGYSALLSNTTGYSNTANGYESLTSNSTGFENTANGYAALYSNTTGNYNTANGYYAGRFTNAGAANETSNSSVYLGYDTRALASGDTNEIVIGHTAQGIGSNTVTLGNDSIVTTALKGNVGIGTTSPADKLHVNSGTENEVARFESSDKVAYISIMDTDTTSPVQGIGSIGDDLILIANTKEYVRVLANGDVGIRQSAPIYDLDVDGEGRFTGDLRCLSLIQTSQTDQKTGITNITKTKAKAIPFKEFSYKSSIDGSGRKRYGVLAEDIENDYPELVHTGADGIKGVNYIDLLVKRVAELEKELEDATGGFTGTQTIVTSSKGSTATMTYVNGILKSIR